MLSRKILQSLYPADRIEPILTSIYNVSLRATEIIEMGTDNHLGELSVDIALDRDAHPWIIELNGKPQKEIYTEFPIVRTCICGRFNTPDTCAADNPR